MFYIYEKSSSRIEPNPSQGKHYLRAEYATMPAAKAALTRMHRKFERINAECRASEHSWERAREDRPENTPLYRCAIAEADYYHKNLEKFKLVKSMMNPAAGDIRISVNTPSYMDPSCESYWSM